jgi:Txe/YoeB family toxin of Txe-Axe toxin-antitoxin module
MNKMRDKIEEIYKTFNFDRSLKNKKHYNDTIFILENYDEIKLLCENDSVLMKKVENIINRIRLHNYDSLGYHVLIEEDCEGMTVDEYIDYANHYDEHREKMKSRIVELLEKRIDNLEKYD